MPQRVQDAFEHFFLTFGTQPHSGYDEEGRRESSRGRKVIYNNIGLREPLVHDFNGRKDLEERIESVDCQCPGGYGNSNNIGGSGYYGGSRYTTRRPSFGGSDYYGGGQIGGHGYNSGGSGYNAGGWYTTRRPFYNNYDSYTTRRSWFGKK